MHRRALIGLAVLVSLNALRAAEGVSSRDFLARLHASRVSWGEVGVSESRGLKVRGASGGETAAELPHGMALEFTIRSRVEPAPGAEGLLSPPRLETTPFGAILIAGEFEEADGWESLRERLEGLLASLELRGYPGFFESFENQLASAVSAAGKVELNLCISRGDEKDRAVVLTVRPTVQEGKVTGVTRGFEGLRDPAPICGSLRDAMRFLPADRTIPSGFTFAETLEDRLVIDLDESRLGDPVPWPRGASLTRSEPPPGATGFSWNEQSGTRSRQKRMRAEPGRAEPVLLEMEANPTELDPAIVDGLHTLIRWRAVGAARSYGPSPTTTGSAEELLVWGFFLTNGPAPLVLDRFLESVSRDLEARNAAWEAAPIEEAIVSHIFDLGAVEGFSLFCPRAPTDGNSARYCVGQACAPVQNGTRICSALAGRFP